MNKLHKTMHIHPKKENSPISQERIDALNADIQMGIDDIKAGRTMDGETAFKKLMSKYE
jgi:predicted transcriptional regulator